MPKIKRVKQSVDSTIHAKKVNGSTALLSASECGHFETLKFFIDNGARVNAKNGDGHTALMHASDNTHDQNIFIEIAKFLLKSRADINATDCKGRTA